MPETELNKTFKKTIIPFLIWGIVLVFSVLFNWLGNKESISESVSLFALCYSLTFTIFYGIKIHSIQKKI